MSVESVRSYLAEFGLANKILEFEESSATVELAAHAVGTEPARIAKTLSFMIDGAPVLIVFAGDARINNQAFKAQFHTKAKFLTPEQAVELVGHAVGGVCPFAVHEGVSVYLDESLRRFDVVYPAAGSSSSAVELTIAELERASRAIGWINVSMQPEA